MSSSRDGLSRHFILQQEEDEELLDDETDRTTAIAALAILTAGALEDHQNQIEKRKVHRAYLTRSELLPNPREGTPWQQLRESRSDQAYIVTMGFDVSAFELLLSSGFEQHWNDSPIDRPDVPSTAAPRTYRRSLDAAGGLGLALHFLSSTMHEISLQQIFALVPSTVTRYIRFAMRILLETLRSMPEASINWPSSIDEFNELSDLVCARHSRLEGAFATIDGLNLPCQTSDNVEIENATYNGWLHEHFISSVLVFSPKGDIIACNMNCPGSWHDSRVAQPIYHRLRDQTPPGYYIVADTAFPRGTKQIEGRIQAPIKAGQRLPSDKARLADLMSFDRQLLSYRQTAEWGMRALQGSFGRLRVPLDVTHQDLRGDLIESCFRLHQIRTRVVGINQIKNVYVPVWTAGDQADIWANFKDMLFSEQRKRDRVSAFHIVPSYDNVD